MQIKCMKTADIPQVVKLGRECFSHPWSQEEYLDACNQPDKIYLVACREEEIVGSCVIWCSFETADLCNIVVDWRYRRQGIAASLLERGFVLCRKRGVERVLLEVRESNLEAISLYRQLQFQEISRRKKYYREPVEDALIMEVIL